MITAQVIQNNLLANITSLATETSTDIYNKMYKISRVTPYDDSGLWGQNDACMQLHSSSSSVNGGSTWEQITNKLKLTPLEAHFSVD